MIFQKTRRMTLGATVLIVALLAGTGAARATPLLDLEGDTFGSGPVQLDIASADATYDSNALQIMLSFFTPISAPSANQPNSLVGFFDLDTDQNPLTGNSNFFGNPALGDEYFVDFFSEVGTPGFVNIVNTFDNSIAGSAPITYGAQSLTATIPLSALNNDDGQVNFASTIGTFPEPTDTIPNEAGFGVSSPAGQPSPVPEPGTMALMGVGLASLVGAARKRKKESAEV